MGVQETARRLSYEQRELLILHVAGPQPVDYSIGSCAVNARRSMQALVNRGMIRFGGPHETWTKPKITTLTELGREAAAVVLGDCADMIVNAGQSDELRPFLVSARKLSEFRLLATSAAALTSG